LWKELPEEGPIGAECPFPIILDLFATKGAGASYWQVDPEDSNELSRVIAAYTSAGSTVSGVSFVHVPVDMVKQLNVSHKKSASSSPDKLLGNVAHFDLNVQSVSQALKLVELMRPTVVDCTQVFVKRSLFKSIRDGFIKVEDLKDPISGCLVRTKHVSFPND
jgi:hypothetical protein